MTCESLYLSISYLGFFKAVDFNRNFNRRDFQRNVFEMINLGNRESNISLDANLLNGVTGKR